MSSSIYNKKSNLPYKHDYTEKLFSLNVNINAIKFSNWLENPMLYRPPELKKSYSSIH